MSLIKNIVIAAIISAAFLKVADVIFSFVYTKDHLVTSVTRGAERSIVLREFNPNQIASIQPSDQYIKGTDSLKKINYFIEIDSNGFIGNGNGNGNLLDSDPKIRIIFLGGSTTESLYVQEKNRFASIVERSLRRDLSQYVLTHNAGVSGNNSMHSNFSFLAKGIPLKPDFAILMHNINDFSLLSKTESYWLAPSSRSLVAWSGNSPSELISLLKFIKNNLFPNLYAYLKPRLFTNEILSNDEFLNYREDFSQINFQEIEQQFQSSLTTFIQVAKSWGITPVLMTQFNRVNVDDPVFQIFFRSLIDTGISPNEFVQTYKKFNQITRTVAKENNVFLIDLDLLIPSTPEYIFDTVHLNDNGSKYAASIISEHLIEIIDKN
jgi:hypothetical protein